MHLFINVNPPADMSITPLQLIIEILLYVFLFAAILYFPFYTSKKWDFNKRLFFISIIIISLLSRFVYGFSPTTDLFCERISFVSSLGIGLYMINLLLNYKEKHKYSDGLFIFGAIVSYILNLVY